MTIKQDFTKHLESQIAVGRRRLPSTRSVSSRLAHRPRPTTTRA